MKPQPNYHLWMLKQEPYVPCPTCNGEGETTDPIEQVCRHCLGLGWVDPKQVDHICANHAREDNIGRCYWRYTCEICGHQWTVDSGD